VHAIKAKEARQRAGFLLTGQLPNLYAVAQPSKIVEGLNLHWLRSRRNSDNEIFSLFLFIL
jgi:hypothetical protein